MSGCFMNRFLFLELCNVLGLNFNFEVYWSKVIKLSDKVKVKFPWFEQIEVSNVSQWLIFIQTLGRSVCSVAGLEFLPNHVLLIKFINYLLFWTCDCGVKTIWSSWNTESRNCIIFLSSFQEYFNFNLVLLFLSQIFACGQAKVLLGGIWYIYFI